MADNISIMVNEEAKFHDDLAQIVATMDTLVRTYNPDKYAVSILQLNKSEWIQKVEDCSINATRIINKAKTKLWFNDDVKMEADNFLETLDQTAVLYVTSVNMKLIKDPVESNAMQPDSKNVIKEGDQPKNDDGVIQTQGLKPREANGGKVNDAAGLSNNGGWKSIKGKIQFFRTPIKYKSCRICLALERDGKYEDIFENHWSDHVIGCPKFAEMTPLIRRMYAIKAKLCLFCLDSNWIFNGSKHPSCDPFQKQVRYTCKEFNCKDHYLVCSRHVDRNSARMEIDKKNWEIKKKNHPDPEEDFQKDLKRLQKAMLDSANESHRDVLTCYYDLKYNDSVLTPNSVAVSKVTFARSDDGPPDTNAPPRDQADSDWSLND